MLYQTPALYAHSLRDIARRLIHYFTTYKDIPGEVKKRMEFMGLYGAQEAKDVIQASVEDYQDYVKSH